MRLSMVALMASLALVPACTGPRTLTATTAPTVSYAYIEPDDFDTVAEEADRFCEAEYDRSAVLIERDARGGRYEATFSCD